MSHTPGPWQACDTEDCGNPGCAAIYDTKGCGIFAPDDDTRPDAEVRLNAVLAAAAPDLLEALERILAGQAAEERGEDGGDWADHWEAARAAVKKARGAS